jgi:dolichyl-diphosphooligosaccharide--protein glycosyltransferase
MVLPVLGEGGFDFLYRVSLPVAIVVPIVLSIISRLMAGRALKPVYYPVTLLGLAGIGLAFLYVINPSLFQSMLSQFRIFRPGGAMLTVMEVFPLTLPIAWYTFTTSFFISFISLAMLIYLIIKEKSADKTLFLVWSVIMLIALLGQRRFGYYYAINAALLTGYFSWKMLDLAGLRTLLAKPKEVVRAVKKFKKKEKKTREKAKPRTFMQPRDVWVKVVVVGIVLFFVVLFPNIGRAKNLAIAPIIMEEGWYTSLLWLRDNSPEPFVGDPDFYYEIYETPFHYPESAYGVMSWWDYGYFIMQIARRIPNANPGQAGAVEAAQFFTAQDESSANEIADRLGSKYVVISYAMPTLKFHAKPEWAGISADKFYGIYFLPGQDGGQWVTLYYPAYFKSMVARLYNFGGKAVVPGESTVISYNEVIIEGERHKRITNAWSFPTYEDAQTFVANQPPGNYRIGSPNPFSSPVPLEALHSYELVHQSEATVAMFGQTLPTVKIFKYLGYGES